MKNLKINFHQILKYQKKNLSVIHNYNSPYQLYCFGKLTELDDEISGYNIYVQAFLSKRWTHKKEIAPKIKILRPIPGYRETLFTQQSYIMNVLFEIDQIKYMKSIGNIDTAYWISCFFEDYEKNVIDSVLEKVIVSGRVVQSEDIILYEELRNKAESLMRIFYDGDLMTPFEREIERMYLTMKQGKFFLNKNIEEKEEYEKIRKSRVYLTYSESNKIQGHVNFRMHHPSYFFRSHPKFEKIDLTLMFKTLYEVRYYSTNKIFTKLKLIYQYRESLLKKPSRAKLLGKYYLLQILQYTDSYEFLNCFNLGLNFKESFYFLIMHMWLIIQRLKEFENEDKRFADYLINELIDNLIRHGQENFFKFQYLDGSTKKKIANLKFYIIKMLDSYTFYFKINPITSENPYYYLTKLINTNIFSNSKDSNDKYLLKISMYLLQNYYYMNNKSYSDIEKSDINFSVTRIPINYQAYFEKYTDCSRKKMLDLFISSEDLRNSLFMNYSERKEKLIFKHGSFPFKYPFMKDKTKAFNYLWNLYIKLPYEIEYLYQDIDYSKRWGYKIAIFTRRELNPNFYSSIELNEEKMKSEANKVSNLAWKRNEIKLGLGEIGNFEEKSKKYRERMNQNTLN